MTVGTHGTGDGSKGPDPSTWGMQEGRLEWRSNAVPCHGAVSPLSHPHPNPLTPRGLYESNPSTCEATRSTCEPQVATVSSSKVASDRANVVARLHIVGISAWSN